MRQEQESLLYQADALVLVVLLLVLMLATILSGASLGRARNLKHNENPANSTVVASLFGLLAFLLAFTFSMSASRFDARREAIVSEANAIGTAMLRADLYPDSIRTAFRRDFKAYIEARIQYFDANRDLQRLSDAAEKSDSLGNLLWQRASGLARTDPNFVRDNQMIPALNEMFDDVEVRAIREAARVPDSIILMLFVLCIASAFYVGYISVGKGNLDWFIMLGFCLLTSMVIYITLDLDRPRRGFIKLEGSQRAMIDLRKL